MGCNIDESAVLILAAGASGRMGFPKPLLLFNDDESFLERLINIYSQADIGEIIVVVESLIYEILIRRDFPFLKQITLILNTQPELGRMHSIRLGLEHVEKDQYCFIQNIDEPFIDVKLLVGMAAKAKKNSYVEPVLGEHGGHPVLIGPVIAEQIKSFNYRFITLKELLVTHHKVGIPVKNEDLFININTVADYKTYIKRDPGTV